MCKQQRILEDLAKGVVEFDSDLTKTAAQEAINENVDVLLAINDGLIKGMNEAGRLYEEEEYFVPELLLASDSLYTGLEVLTPHLQQNEQDKKIKIVLGVVQGDTHDIGKNLVKILLEVGRFEIYDLGRDIPAEDFVSKAKEVNADIIGLSTLMTTTMPQMPKVINLLKQEGLNNRIKVIIGGGPISPAYAESIGADGYAENANNAVHVIKGLLGEQTQEAIA